MLVEKTQKWPVCCTIFHMPSFHKILEVLWDFHRLFLSRKNRSTNIWHTTGACGPPEKLCLALVSHSYVLYVIVKLAYSKRELIINHSRWSELSQCWASGPEVAFPLFITIHLHAVSCIHCSSFPPPYHFLSWGRGLNTHELIHHYALQVFCYCCWNKTMVNSLSVSPEVYCRAIFVDAMLINESFQIQTLQRT